MNDGFEKRQTTVVQKNTYGNSTWGRGTSAQFYTRQGVSSLYSSTVFLSEETDAELEAVPDWVLSETLQSDFESAVTMCAHLLLNTKYLPETTEVFETYGWVEQGQREGVRIEKWKDTGILNCDGEPLYTDADLDLAAEAGDASLKVALHLIVKDICESGGFLTEDWYAARIVQEYFSEYPLRNESAFLIGELWKELCAKNVFEGDLTCYYAALAADEAKRQRGTSKNKANAAERRERCVGLFAELYSKNGARFLLAPDKVQAEELRREALERWPTDYQRGGVPYRSEWFLRHVVEDRALDIIRAVEQVDGRKA